MDAYLLRIFVPTESGDDLAQRILIALILAISMKKFEPMERPKRKRGDLVDVHSPVDQLTNILGSGGEDEGDLWVEPAPLLW